MERCTSELLESYLLKYGWAFDCVGTGLWKTAFQGEDREFPVSIIMTENLISFIIQPFIELSIDWDNWPEISKLLLDVNSRMTLAKFAVGADDRMELSIEVLKNGIDYDSLELILGLLTYYADLHHEGILGDLDLIGYRHTESLSLPT